MARTVLELANDVLDETQYERLETLVGSDEPVARQAVALLNRVGDELAHYGHSYSGWPVLRRQHEVIIEADGDGGIRMDYDLPEDFGRFIVETAWNDTREWPQIGPVTPQVGAAVDVYPYTLDTVVSGFFGTRQGTRRDGSLGQIFRVWERAGDLSPGDRILYLYVSSHWLQGVAGSEPPTSARVRADTDVPLLDNHLMHLGYLAALAAARGSVLADSHQRRYEVERDKRYGEAQAPRAFDLRSSGPLGGLRRSRTAWPWTIGTLPSG